MAESKRVERREVEFEWRPKREVEYEYRHEQQGPASHGERKDAYLELFRIKVGMLVVGEFLAFSSKTSDDAGGGRIVDFLAIPR